MRNLAGIVIGICVLAALPARADSVFDVGGFEGYSPGSVAGQFNWQNDSSASQPIPSVYEDAFTVASGHGKVLKVDPSSLSTNDYSGAYLPFGSDLYADGMHQISISFDQFRGTLNQTAFILEAPGPILAASAYQGYQDGLTGIFHPTGRVQDPGIPLTAGTWQHVNLLLDYDTQEVTSDVDGVLPSLSPQIFRLGVPAVKQFRGIAFLVAGTNRGTPNGPNYFDNLVVSPPNSVPEPASMALLATSIAPLLLRRKRKQL